MSMTDRDNLPPALLTRFQEVCATPSDINQHLGLLWGLARQCESIAELGVRRGVSTVALLAAQPDRLECFDIEDCPVIRELIEMSGQTMLIFRQIDSRQAVILPTDLLHIDTIHAYSCLSIELQRHAPKVRRWIALHDTEVFGIRGDDGGDGLNRAIDELVAGGKWQVWCHFPHNHGMTVLQRIKPE